MDVFTDILSEYFFVVVSFASKLSVVYMLLTTNCPTQRFGFHWPPFTSVDHLHLHVLAPASQMGLLSRLAYRPGSPWFVTVSVLSVA